MNLEHVAAIPAHDLPLPTDPNFGFQIQLIANAAAFHFATIEQGGSSLYLSFLPKASSLEVLRIVGAIGGTVQVHQRAPASLLGDSAHVHSPCGGQGGCCRPGCLGTI